MVTEKGLWRTGGAGKDWVKLPKVPAPALRVFFVDETRGWAACGNKTVLATTDGGPTGSRWRSRQTTGNHGRDGIRWIAFATPQIGLITGWDIPLSRERFPDWLDPQRAVTQRETPHLTITVETHDGGATLEVHFRPPPSGRSRGFASGPGKRSGDSDPLLLVPVSSEVYDILWPTGKTESAYRDADFCATDAWVMPDGTGISLVRGLPASCATMFRRR